MTDDSKTDKCHDYGRNFDDLAPKFKRKVYGAIKGEIRLAVIKRDLGRFIPALFRNPGKGSLTILDAGCGTAPLSPFFTLAGHQVFLCDISVNMLDIAKERIRQSGIRQQVQLWNRPIQALPSDQTFNIILCHAVLEWVKDPVSVIDSLIERTAPGGYLSLTFYNIHSIIFKNLLRANYKKIKRNSYSGWPGSLTPTYPRDPGQVMNWLKLRDMDIIAHSGIRVFHDYILDLKDREKDRDSALALELRFSNQMPYRDLGRYQHMLCRKK